MSSMVVVTNFDIVRIPIAGEADATKSYVIAFL